MFLVTVFCKSKNIIMQRTFREITDEILDRFVSFATFKIADANENDVVTVVNEIFIGRNVGVMGVHGAITAVEQDGWR